jgi:hypothetical protein
MKIVAGPSAGLRGAHYLPFFSSSRGAAASVRKHPVGARAGIHRNCGKACGKAVGAIPNLSQQ